MTVLHELYQQRPDLLRRHEVYIDGGVRRGTDVLKALCLGAKAVLAGRAYAYGLGAAGGEGVAHAIGILKSDFVRTMKLLGCPALEELNGSFIDVPRSRLSDRMAHKEPIE